MDATCENPYPGNTPEAARRQGPRQRQTSHRANASQVDRSTVADVIGYLRGIARTPRIVDVSGVGYVVATPTPLTPGDEVELHVHTQVRDDAINLYGFTSEDDKHLFEALVKVTGVGPSIALALLAGLGAGTVADAISRKDAKTLATVKGVGGKVAEKIVTLCNLPEGIGGDRRADEIVTALIGLGYDRRQALAAAQAACADEDEDDATLLTRAITIASRGES